VFRMTIAALVPGLQPTNVLIINVTDTVIPDPVPEDTDDLDQFKDVLSYRQFRPNSVRKGVLEGYGIDVRYTINFVAQRVAVQSSDPVLALEIVKNTLNDAVTAGTFTAELQSRASQFSSPALLAAEPVPGALRVEPTVATTTVHSAKPTSQPSSQPSGQPSRQPTGQPTSSPTAQPSTQPSTAPTGQPSASPTVSMQTKWMMETASVFENTIRMGSEQRTSYYALEVSSEPLYGSCESWNNYLVHSLPATLNSKVFHSLTLTTETGEVQSLVSVVTCSDQAISTEIVNVLSSPLLRDNTTVPLNVSITCDRHEWVIHDCYAPNTYGYEVQPSTTGGTVSRALCIGCSNPCAQYNCTGTPESTVISPCTRVENCPYIVGSLQIFTAFYSDSEGTGYTPIVMWYGVLWGYVILTVLVYNFLISRGWDWEYLRSVPKLPFRHRHVQDAKLFSFMAIAPEPASSLRAGLHGASAAAADVVPPTSHDIASNMYAILDRLVVGAGLNVLLFGRETLPKVQRFWHRMLTYNHYLAPYSSATTRERVVHGLNILTRLSWITFCVALCYSYSYYSDDQTCYAHDNYQSCTERVTPFDSHEEYCTWVGLVGPDRSYFGGGQDLHQAQCVWHLYTGNVISMLHIVIVTIAVTVVPRIFYTNFLVESVIFAPGGASTAFKTRYVPSPPTQPSERFATLRNIVRRLNRVRSAPSEPNAELNADEKTAPRKPPAKFNKGKKPVTEEHDPRLYSLTVEDRKGEIVTCREAKSDQEISALLYSSFLCEYTAYRRLVMAQGGFKARHFEREWAASNLFLWEYEASIAALTEPKGLTAASWRETHFPTSEAAVTSELLKVHQTSDSLAPEYKDYLQNDEDQFSVRLMVLFFADLLGKDSIQCRLVRAMLRDLLQDSAPFRDVRNWVKFCVILFMLATCMCLVYGSIELLQKQSQRRHWYWIITVALVIGVDCLALESVEALWFRWVLPLCVSDSVAALKRTAKKILRRFERGGKGVVGHTMTLTLRQERAMSHNASPKVHHSPSHSVEALELNTTPLKDFSMPNYQFVSTNLAQRFPRHVASRIVLSYESVYPRTITGQRWPNTATVAQMLFGGQRWSSGLGFESIGYVLFSYTAMWVGIHWPAWLQQVFIAGLLSLSIWLVSLLIHYVQSDFNVGISLAALIVGVAIIVVVSYFFAWDNDSEYALAAVEALNAGDSDSDKEEAGSDRTVDLEQAHAVAPTAPQTDSPHALRLAVTPVKPASHKRMFSVQRMHSFGSQSSTWSPQREAREDKPAPSPSPAFRAPRSIKVVEAKPRGESPLPSPSAPPVQVSQPAPVQVQAVPIGVVTPFKREEYVLSSSSDSGSD
jgi:hypothetical protein